MKLEARVHALELNFQAVEASLSDLLKTTNHTHDLLMEHKGEVRKLFAAFEEKNNTLFDETHNLILQFQSHNLRQFEVLNLKIDTKICLLEQWVKKLEHKFDRLEFKVDSMDQKFDARTSQLEQRMDQLELKMDSRMDRLESLICERLPQNGNS